MRRLLLPAVALILALGLCARSPDPASAASPYAGTYSGVTSQGQPVVVVVSSDGRQVTRASTALVLTCSDGGSVLAPDDISRVPLSPSGRASFRYSNVAGEAWDGTPSTRSGSMQVSIRAGMRALSGRLTASQISQNADGTTRECSAAVALKATAKRDPAHPLGGFYGGVTGQGHPVVIQLARDGRMVTAIRGEFDLRCSLGGFRFVFDGWVRMPVSGGSNRFAQTVRNQPARYDDGTPFQMSTSIVGTVDRVGRTITGRWRVVWTTPGATATDMCDSGQVTFRAGR